MNKKALSDAMAAGGAAKAAAAALAAESVEARATRVAAEDSLRALTHASLVSKGVTPSAMPALLGINSPTRAGLRELEKRGINVGAVGTVGRDLPKAYDLLTNHLKKKLTGAYGFLVTDGATFAKDKAVAILFETSSHPKPVLLALIVPDSLETYDHEAAAEDIRTQMLNYNISHDHVTSLMGDNVEFNTALARALGVARAKCLAHALNLGVKHAFKQLPQLKGLLQDAAGIITAGGTSKRAAELRSDEYGLDPNKMMYYSNRFGSVVLTAQYREENFGAVKLWHTMGMTLPSAADAAAPADDDDDVNDDEAGLSKSALLLKRAERARLAYQDPWAQLHLIIVDIMFGEVPRLITLVSGTFDAVPSDILDDLRLYRARLASIAAPPAAGGNGVGAGARATINQATARGYPEATIAKKGEACNKFGLPLMKAAAAALANYDKHITPAMEVLTYRFRFDVRREPERSATGAYDYSKEWYGCLPQNFGVAINVEWATYVDEWWSKSAPDPEGDEEDHPKFYWAKMDNHKYWKSKKIWPKLQAVALFWKEVPTSSVSAERVFGVGRIIDVPQRRSMSWDTFRHELSFRIHEPDLDGLLMETLRKLK